MNKRRLRPYLNADLLFALCQWFMRGDGVGTIVERVNQELPEDRHIKRSHVYEYVREGVARRFIVLRAPPNITLRNEVAGHLRQGDAAGLAVVEARPESAADAVAASAADQTFLAMQVVAASRGEVHLALGAGGTTRRVVHHLIDRLRNEPLRVRLVLHALSTGFQGEDPGAAPIAFFGLFGTLGMDVKSYGLFAPSVARAGNYASVKEYPGVAEAFDAARDIDIVVSSLASAEDPHGTLNRYLLAQPEADIAALRNAGWIGDVHYRPYSATGPLAESKGIRAVTILELQDLVTLARRPHKSVILVAGPCGGCRRTRAAALLPLLRSPSLKLWTHIVMDQQTAQELVALGKASARPAAFTSERAEEGRTPEVRGPRMTRPPAPAPARRAGGARARSTAAVYS